MFVLSIVPGMLYYILEEAVDVEEYRKNHNIFIIYCTYSFIISIIVIIINKKLSFKDFLIKTLIKIFLTSFIIFFTYSVFFPITESKLSLLIMFYYSFFSLATVYFLFSNKSKIINNLIRMFFIFLITALFLFFRYYTTYYLNTNHEFRETINYIEISLWYCIFCKTIIYFIYNIIKNNPLWKLFSLFLIYLYIY